jgi:class 3 adenylate cyclase/tetratricopeptide (TPR) repeat protein
VSGGTAAQPRFAAPKSYTPKHLAEKILTSKAALEGERKQVTVLFCDIVGSTGLAERLGEEAMHTLLNRFFELALAEVHRYEGTINQFLGDGFMALSGAPLAHEDHARRAVLAALGIQRSVRDRRAEFGLPPGEELTLRMGLNTGPVVVGKIGDNLRMDYTAVGDTTNLAARLQQLAEPGMIVMSEATQRLVEGFVESSYLGERDVKGLARQRVYRVEYARPGAARFDVALRRGLTPLVGRRRELDVLERRHREARERGAQVVNVTGEAGLGKSRILHEFRQGAENDKLAFFQGYCTADGASTSFLPFIEIVRSAFRLDERDSHGEIERKLRRELELLPVDDETALPLLLNLLGLDPGSGALQGLDGEIVGARTRAILYALVRERCRLSPVVLIIDDVHWIDSASEEVILGVARTQEPIPLTIFCAHRPGYLPPWTGLPNVSEVSLGPLSQESCLHLVQHRLEAQSLPAELTQFVVERAEGNPLFAEELLSYLLESGQLERINAGVTFRVSPSGVSVPGTLQNLVMARVDRLTPGPRAVLQAAAVIGRRFSLELVQQVSGVNGNLSQYLRDLERQHLIFRQEVDGREECSFRHALIQEAIYGTLLERARQQLHQRVAESIEQRGADRSSEWAEALAHHWSRTSRADKAVRYLAMAGTKSLRVYAVEEAHERFRQVVALIERVPQAADDAFLAQVLLSWARAYYYRKDFRGLIALERYLPRVEVAGDARLLSLFRFWLGFSYYFGARFDTAERLLEHALAAGEGLGDEECIGYATMGLAYTWTAKPGDRAPDIVDRLGARSLDIAARLGDVYLASKAYLALVMYRITSGRLKEARGFAGRLLELGRQASDPRTVAMGLYSLAYVNAFDERYNDALDNADESLRLSPDPVDRLMARGARGVTLALMGRGPEALELLGQVRRDFVAADFLIMLTIIDFPYGAAMLLSGELAAGVRWIKESMERFATLGNGILPALGHSILGELYVEMLVGARPPLRIVLKNLGFVLSARPFAAWNARRHLEEAVRAGRKVGHSVILVQSLLSLGRLAFAKKRDDEARRCLDEAREVAEREGLAALSEKVRRLSVATARR